MTITKTRFSLALLVLVVALALPVQAYPRPGLTEWISKAADGGSANLFSEMPALSADGRFVAFSSWASNLIPGDENSAYDAFVRDRASGTIQRVSVGPGGAEATGFSVAGGISADGRYVAFQSNAPNLVSGDTNATTDVFVRDRVAGVTTRVSVSSGGVEANGGWSAYPQLSADGRYVVFASEASNLVPGDTNGATDVFVRDRIAGTTERVSVGPAGVEGNAPSARNTGPTISADGRFVAFGSDASNLVPGDGNGATDVFVRDRTAGTTERVSVGPDGVEGNPLAASRSPALSADGRYVAFLSGAVNFVPGDTNTAIDAFVRDRVTQTTERVSVGFGGAEGDSSSYPPTISADGRYVAFSSNASNLVLGDANKTTDTFVRDRTWGITERVSVGPGGAEGDGGSDPYVPALSTDGRYVAFGNYATNLVPGHGQPNGDVYVRDRVAGSTGTAAVTITKSGGKVNVSGWAAFSGTEVSSAQDPPSDGTAIGVLPARDAGAEITGASLTHRSEREDYLLTLRLASLPGPVIGAAPGVLYTLEFTSGGTSYQVRAIRTGTTAGTPAAPYFGLFRCSPTCTEVTTVSGGIGTTGTASVLASIPIAPLGAGWASMTSVKARTALGEAGPGGLQPVDEVTLPNVTTSPSRVDLGIAPASTQESTVVYSGQAALFRGEFAGELSVASLPAGDYRVWARACLGAECGSSWTAVKLP